MSERTIGKPDTPGTMVFTVSGDVDFDPSKALFTYFRAKRTGSGS